MLQVSIAMVCGNQLSLSKNGCSSMNYAILTMEHIFVSFYLFPLTKTPFQFGFHFQREGIVPKRANVSSKVDIN